MSGTEAAPVEPDLDGLDDADGDGVPDAGLPGAGSGPVALVSGASRGIGRHVADALEDAGWTVERGSRAVAPVQDPAAVEEWVADVLERQGAIDLLVNNAGVIDAEVGLLDSDPDEWWATVEVNLRGAYLLTRSVGRHMRSRGSGRVVNVSSGAATRPGEVATAYNVSKTALARLTGSTHLAGIPTLDLMPGVVRTDMTTAMLTHADRTQWTDPDDVCGIVLAFAAGDLDAWSGRFVRAGDDPLDWLLAHGPRPESTLRTLVLHRADEAGTT